MWFENAKSNINFFCTEGRPEIQSGQHASQPGEPEWRPPAVWGAALPPADWRDWHRPRQGQRPQWDKAGQCSCCRGPLVCVDNSALYSFFHEITEIIRPRQTVASGPHWDTMWFENLKSHRNHTILRWSLSTADVLCKWDFKFWTHDMPNLVSLSEDPQNFEVVL